jgi:diguanylate cyclase (GGDEF)-like protein/PAS domain S-box-containing protein
MPTAKQLTRTGWACLIVAVFFGWLTKVEAQTFADPPARTETRAILIVGSEQDYPPFATGMTDATAGGFTVDLWKSLAAETGLKYTITVRPFHELLRDFEDGKIDVLINLAQSDARRQFADFAVPHVVMHGAIFVRKDENKKIQSESDLAGKPLIVLNGDLAHDYALARGWGEQLVLVDTAAQGLRLLATSRHHALLLSKLVGLQEIRKQGLVNLEVIKSELGFTQKFGIAVHKDRPELLYAINEGLALTKSNGKYNALYDQWFGIYQEKGVSWRDLLNYLLPLMMAFLLSVGYFWYRRQVERQLAEAAIAQSRDLLMTIIDTAPVRVFWKGRDLCYLGCNSAFARDVGKMHPAEVTGKDDYQLPWSAHAQRFREEDQAIMASDTARLFQEESIMSLTGQVIWLRRSKFPLRNRNHETIGVLGVYEDITARKQAENKLQQLSTAIEQGPTSVIITDLDGIIEYVNPQFTELTGYSAAEAIGQNPRFMKSSLTPGATYTELWDCLTSGRPWNGELINERKNGEIYWEESRISPVKNAQGETTHYVAVKIDITARKQLEEQVRHLAFHDTLTQLPNRRMLEDRLTRAMAYSKRSGRFGALMFLDLDHFKALNDGHGHDAGDLLLREVAHRLKSCVRETDTVARTGGDEFIVLLSDLGEEKAKSTELAASIAEKIRAVLERPYLLTLAHKKPHDQTNDHVHEKTSGVKIEHHATASIGVVLLFEQKTSHEDMLSRADAAMYIAKQDGGNRVRICAIDT